MWIEKCKDCGCTHSAAHGDTCSGEDDKPMSIRHLRKLIKELTRHPIPYMRCPVDLREEAKQQLAITIAATYQM